LVPRFFGIEFCDVCIWFVVIRLSVEQARSCVQMLSVCHRFPPLSTIFHGYFPPSAVCRKAEKKCKKEKRKKMQLNPTRVDSKSH